MMRSEGGVSASVAETQRGPGSLLAREDREVVICEAGSLTRHGLCWHLDLGLASSRDLEK